MKKDIYYFTVYDFSHRLSVGQDANMLIWIMCSILPCAYSPLESTQPGTPGFIWKQIDWHKVKQQPTFHAKTSYDVCEAQQPELCWPAENLESQPREQVQRQTARKFLRFSSFHSSHWNIFLPSITAFPSQPIFKT